MEVQQPDRWGIVVLIGVLLALISLAVSDLAPDAHVQLALHANEDDGRARLPWGHVRPIDPLASDPETGPEVGVSGMLDAPWKLKAMSAGGYLTLVGGLLIASRRTGDRNLMALTGVVALHPTLIFATGSGIEEPIVAGAFAIVAWGVLAFDGSRRPVGALAVVLGFAIVIGVKIHPSSAWLSLLTLLPMGIWSVLQDRDLHTHWTPIRLGAWTSLIVTLVMVALGASGRGSSLSVLREHPGWFVLAWIIAVDVMTVGFLIIGSVLWPFLSRLGSDELVGEPATLRLTLLISGTQAAIVTYVAALWTLEGTASGTTFEWMDALQMATNGRYVSILLVPALLLIWRMACMIEGFDGWTTADAIERRRVIAGLLILLPFSVFAGAIGQTAWTQTAGPEVAERLQVGEDLLMIGDATWSIHWLYAMHHDLNSEGPTDLTAHWRDVESGWQSELNGSASFEDRGALDEVRLILVAPGVDAPPPLGWHEVTRGQAGWAVYGIQPVDGSR